MSFRVLVASDRHFTDHPALRAALDTLLANRLPEVELLTAGGEQCPNARGELRSGTRGTFRLSYSRKTGTGA
jgi:hypothetical protein